MRRQLEGQRKEDGRIEGRIDGRKAREA